jgi:heme oxygenase
MTDSTTSATSLRMRLREDTRKQHKDAENRPVERAMLQGRLTVAQYTQVLAQRYLLHEQLDRLLDQLCEQRREILPLVGEDHRLGPVAGADLARLGVDPAKIRPLASTKSARRWLQELAGLQPIALVGPHYVFEGSKNGARFIRRGLIKVWGDEHAACLSYLDPHGEVQPLVWKYFADDLDRLDLTEKEKDQIVNAAAGMFDAISAIDDELAQLLDLSEAA